MIFLNVVSLRNCSKLHIFSMYFLCSTSVTYLSILLSVLPSICTYRGSASWKCRNAVVSLQMKRLLPHAVITHNRPWICIEMNVQMFGFVFNIFFLRDPSKISRWFTTSRTGFTDQTRPTPNNSITKVSKYFIRDRPHYE